MCYLFHFKYMVIITVTIIHINGRPTPKFSDNECILSSMLSEATFGYLPWHIAITLLSTQVNKVLPKLF